MKKQELTFSHLGDTKGTYRYSEDAADGEQVVGSLYLRKNKVEGDRPEKLKVTITEAR